MELAPLLRPVALTAGPAAAIALLLLVAALVVDGGDGLDASPLAVASSAMLLVALFGLLATALSALALLRATGRTGAGGGVAVVGTVLVAGGGWAALFVLPGLAEKAPAVLDQGMAGVIVGYIASYVVFSLGWMWAGAALLRARLVPTALGVLLLVGGALAFVPAPEAFRLLPVSIVATLVARRFTAPASLPELGAGDGRAVTTPAGPC
jgi:hypothetical protein